MTTKARTKKRVKRALHQARNPEVALQILDELAPEVAKKVEEVQEGRVPGRIIEGKKTVYNYQDLLKMFPIATFTPMETMPLNYQGVRVQALSGIEMHVPSCFKEIYDSVMTARTRQKAPEGFEGEFHPGAGSLE